MIAARVEKLGLWLVVIAALLGAYIVGKYLTAHERVFQVGARLLHVLNPTARLAGAAGMSVSRFLPGAAVSAAVWTGSWTGIGIPPDARRRRAARSFGIPLTLVVIDTLVGWLLLRQAQRPLLPHTLGRTRRGSRRAGHSRDALRQV
jgi:hypothetical protein